MSARNERIYVDRVSGGTETRHEVDCDTLMAADWAVSGGGRLDVTAWRKGVRTVIASYAPGHWLAVQRARALK